MYYLDTKSPSIIFKEKINSPIYVDKSLLIEKMNDSIRTDGKYICITRPRRFGKTINANMLGAYYTKGYDTHELFDNLKIANTVSYEKHLNQHHVIYINFSRLPDECYAYNDYIRYIRSNLKADIYEQYPALKEKEYSSLDMMLKETNDSFIFILDEL